WHDGGGLASRQWLVVGRGAGTALFLGSLALCTAPPAPLQVDGNAEQRRGKGHVQHRVVEDRRERILAEAEPCGRCRLVRDVEHGRARGKPRQRALDKDSRAS